MRVRDFVAPVPVAILQGMDETTPRGKRAVGRLLSGWLPVIGWAALIYVISAQPNLRFVPDELLDFVVRKLGHMAVFGILALLLWRALAGFASGRTRWAWALALAVLYAVTDELHQSGVTGRHPSAADVAIDAAGALIALMAVSIVEARRARHGPNA
jgi:VanZ family protein